MKKYDRITTTRTQKIILSQRNTGKKIILSQRNTEKNWHVVAFNTPLVGYSEYFAKQRFLESKFPLLEFMLPHQSIQSLCKTVTFYKNLPLIK